jgi:hypothetical protein
MNEVKGMNDGVVCLCAFSDMLVPDALPLELIGVEKVSNGVFIGQILVRTFLDNSHVFSIY